MAINIYNSHFAAGTGGDAKTGYILLEPSIAQPAGIVSEPATNPISLTEYAQSTYVIFFIVTMIAAVVMLVYYGAAYMTSDIASFKAEATKRLTNVLIGLGIALLSWLMLNQINPDLATNLKVNIPGTKASN